MTSTRGSWLKRIIGVVLIVVGVLAFAGSFVWRSQAVPRLVKYPTDVDETPMYAGSVTIYLNQKTYAPLAKPIVAPLQLSRHILAEGKLSTSNRVVLNEKINLTAQGQFTGNLDAQYVMNRRTIRNVESKLAWAFAPANVVNRRPAYRLAFPFDTKSQSYLIYKNEVATTYRAKPDGEGEVQGLKVINFTGRQDKPLPVSRAYLAAISAITPLPSQLTLDQLKPILKASGVDVDVLLPALLPHLSKPDTAALLALAQQKIKLDYLYSFSGADSVEPSTGSIVDVHDVDETLYAAPDPTLLPKLKAILQRYPNVPAAVQGVTGLEKLAANPVKVFENKFSQTPASVADIASTVKDKRSQKRLATTIIPNALVIAGPLLAVVGIVLVALPRRRKRTAEPAGPGSGPATASGTAPPDASEELTIVPDAPIAAPAGPETPSPDPRPPPA
jgi:hypothetical protein